VRVEPAPRELRSYVERFTGPQPVDCGQHSLAKPFAEAGSDELQKSVACALSAAQDKKPFWALKQNQGIDSLVFQGILGTTDGVTFRFNYDSAPCGNPECPGRFSIERCERPAVASRGGRTEFTCQR